MTTLKVEWVLLVRFGSSAHRATYGRLPGTLYSKDFIQLSRKPSFVEELESILPSLSNGGERAALTYKWPGGSADGTLVKVSADRPHLSWVTSEGAPPPWKLTSAPTQDTVETIRGFPNHSEEKAADAELEQLQASDFGQPFLVAVKLMGEADTLHLRVHIQDPENEFSWADLSIAPAEIQELASKTRPSSVLASRLFDSEHELYFDTSKKADPWSDSPGVVSLFDGAEVSAPTEASATEPTVFDSDSIAENLEHSDEEVSGFEQSVEDGDFEVPDSTATVKTRGSAQKAFSKKVKDNYEWRCAITGISSQSFLIASHIVPWSVDEAIRLDPANGICLSVLVDRAFENGFLVIQDDLTVTVDWAVVGDDQPLAEQLERYDGMKLRSPKAQPPKAEYLQRRRNL